MIFFIPALFWGLIVRQTGKDEDQTPKPSKGLGGNEQTARSSPRRIARCETSSGADGEPVALDRGVLTVDFLSGQAYENPVAIPRDC